MAAATHPPPLRTPSPKIRVHRSQSFDSPTSRVSITPIEDSPYSKSTGTITQLPPHYDTLQTLSQRSKAVLRTKLSKDSFLSDSTSSADSTASSSPTEGESTDGDGAQYRLFSSGSPAPPSPSPSSPSPQIQPMRPALRARHLDIGTPRFQTMPLPQPSSVSSSSGMFASALSMYQDVSVPMYDPWLVRVVLDLYDIRGFEWTVIAEMVLRMWGFRTCSSEVLGILSGNGRVGRQWWD
ncbi:unnamed protein product [Periconia digitata]|uniref:Uncharacterized protein n=1 Tax=Periconia digitata TaxID=1303443 RepID=A0A9W4UHD2_9PLEO|nr:unnamed protein product [Periconia digitata]